MQEKEEQETRRKGSQENIFSKKEEIFLDLCFFGPG